MSRYPALAVIAILIGCLRASVVHAEVLTHIADIRSLDRNVADAGERVDVTGVVTWSIRSSGFVVQDDTGGIWAQTKLAQLRGIWKGEANLMAALHPGLLIRVEGISSAGGFAPTILPEHITVLGTRALPAAEPLDRAQFFDGSDSGKRVEARGTVVGFQPTAYGWELRLEANPDVLWVGVVRSVLPDPAKVLDEQVVVRGVAGTEFNSRGEFYSAIILVSAPSDFRLEPQRGGSSVLPLVDLERLRTFHPTPEGTHRVRIRGVVTFASHDRFVYVQQDNRAVRVNLSTASKVKPGDSIEAAGYVDMSSPTAELGGAEITVLSHGNPLPAVATAPEQIVRSARVATTQSEAASVDYDGRLIQFTAILLGIDSPLDAADPTRRLIVQQGKLVLTATLSGLDAPALDKFTVGSELRITGIVQMEFPAMGGAKLLPMAPHLSVLIRDPRDIAVLHAPSWWTPHRLLTVIAIAALALAVMLAWIWQLRREVRRRAKQLVAEIKKRRDAAVAFKATLGERNRLAANLHDTLVQTMSGIRFQLDVCKTTVNAPEAAAKATESLAVARQMVDTAVDELRNSVWSLRALPYGGAEFREALQTLSRRMAVRADASVEVSVDGDFSKVSNFLAGNLLLATQEAVQNAIKHAKAKKISVSARLTETPAQIEVIVVDDGVGFQPADVPGYAQGHFGLTGLGDRIRSLDGQIQFASAPNQGTSVTIRVPLKPYDADVE